MYKIPENFLLPFRDFFLSFDKAAQVLLGYVILLQTISAEVSLQTEKYQENYSIQPE